jgi:hypothetical protein
MVEAAGVEPVAPHHFHNVFNNISSCRTTYEQQLNFILQSIPLSIQQETVSPDLTAPFLFLSHAISEYNPGNKWRWHAEQ